MPHKLRCFYFSQEIVSVGILWYEFYMDEFSEEYNDVKLFYRKFISIKIHGFFGGRGAGNKYFQENKELINIFGKIKN